MAQVVLDFNFGFNANSTAKIGKQELYLTVQGGVQESARISISLLVKIRITCTRVTHLYLLRLR